MVGAVGVADEIGSGEDLPRRRNRRFWTAVWAVAVLAVVGSLLVPLVRGSFADEAARRLAESWAAYDGLEGRRYDLVRAVQDNAGLGDDQLLVEARRAADRLEIRAVTELRAHAATGHTWVGDVAEARRAVLATFTEQIKALQVDLASATPTVGIVSSNRGAVLKERADELVTALVDDHHLGKVRPHPVAMPALSASLEQTERLTSARTGLHLVVQLDGSSWDYDLDNGRRSKLHTTPGFVVTSLAGDSVVLARMREITVLPARGPAVTLPTGRFPRVLGADPTGFWLGVGGQVRRIDATGRPDTPWIDLPAGNWFAQAASRESIGLSRYAGGIRSGGYAPDAQELALWWPETGRMVPVASSCPYADVTAAVDVLLVFGCRDDPALAVHDSGSGKRVATVESLPARGGQVVSADGRTLAIGRNGGTPAVVLLDLGTGSPTSIGMPERVTPIAWSPDDRWLVLSRNGALNLANVNNLALLDTQTKQLFALRLPFNLDSDYVFGLR